MGAYETLRLETSQDGIVEVVLDRPDVRNAMSVKMGAELCKAVAEISGDRSVRSVLLRGEGKVFAAGGDLDFIEARLSDTPERNRRIMRDYYDLFLSLTKLRVPTIAVLHGAAIGAGLCLALACDLRFATPDAKLALNFVRLGLHPGMGATWLLPRLIGPARAAELLLTGRTISGSEACNLGMVNQLKPKEEILDHARAAASEIAQNAPLAVARTKENLGWSGARSLEQALDAEATAQALDYRTEDMKEGLLAARERRVAVFRGS